MTTVNGVGASPPRLDHGPSASASPVKRKRTQSVEAPAQSNGVQVPVVKHEASEVKPSLEGTKVPTTGTTAVATPISELHETAALMKDEGDDRTVLTLFGSAPQPRQLFTSRAKPISSPDQPRSTFSDTIRQDDGAKSTPLHEVVLPNGITTTKLVSVDLVEEPPEKRRRVATLGEVFPPPPTLAPLQAPKPSKHTSTRGSTVEWYQPSEGDLPLDSSRRGTYSTQPLLTGKSLGYNAPPAVPRPPSPDLKRRLGGAQSAAEASMEIPEDILAAYRAAETDALFRRAFSGFAPTRDDSAVIVPEEVKNRIWWSRVGERRYERLMKPWIFPESTINGEEDAHVIDVNDAEAKVDEVDIKPEAIDSWVAEEIPSDLKTENGTEEATEKDVEEVLKDVSELLETLNSYQRVRFLNPATLGTPARSDSTPASTHPTADLIGTPSSPSSTEMMVYQTLRSQLALLISSLPPFAVAKLNGDRLAELNITSLIPVEVDDFRGVMEPEEIPPPIKPKVTAATPVGNARAGPYSTPQPSRSHQAASGPPVPRTAPHGPPPGGYYPPHPTQHGSPIKSSRAPPRPSPAPSSGSYGPPPPYHGQTPRPSHPGAAPYGAPTNPGQYFQPPAYPIQYQSGGRPAPAAGTPPPHSPYQRPSQPAYQSHAQQRQAQQHLYPSHPYPAQGPPRATSPQKAPYTPNPQGHPSPHLPPQQRGGGYPSPHPHPPPPHHLPHGQPTPPAYPSSGRYFQTATPPGHGPPPGAPPHHNQQPYHPPPPQQPPNNPSRSLTPGGGTASQPVGASGFHTYLTAEQQALMMERQRAQLVASGQMQGLTAASHNQRAASGHAALGSAAPRPITPGSAAARGPTTPAGATIAPATPAATVAQAGK